MKGIILAGGKGTRLYPATIGVCKQLLPVYDKPMIYYPLSILMLANIREILIISTPQDLPRFQRLFGDGSHLGLQIQYRMQSSPKGIADAFLIGEDYIKDDNVALILGDNIFYGHDLPSILQRCSSMKEGAAILGFHVKNPSQYGVIEFDADKKPIDIIEKPKNPPSNWAVTGLYFYDQDVVEYAKSLKPSKRGELEITDINKMYLQKNTLRVEMLGRGYAWLDTGTFDDMLKASNFIQTLQERQGIKIACVEEVAYRMGFINEQAFIHLIESRQKNEYSQYLYDLLKQENAIC